MKCVNCDYEGIIDKVCPSCGIDIYSDKYKNIAKENTSNEKSISKNS